MAQRCYYFSTNDAVGSVKSKQVKSRKATGGKKHVYRHQSQASGDLLPLYEKSLVLTFLSPSPGMFAF